MKDIIDIIKKCIILELFIGDMNVRLNSIRNDFDLYDSKITNEELAELVYSTLIHYTFTDKEISKHSKIYNTKEMQEYAINTSIRTIIKNDTLDFDNNESMGFYGDLLLELFLHTFYGTDKLICRGKLYDPSSSSEVTGYDAFHLIKDAGKTQLWFGEAKLTSSLTPGETIKKIINSFKDVLKEEYLKENLLLITKRNIDTNSNEFNQYLINNNINLGLRNKKILNDIIRDIQLDKIVYPIFICFEKRSTLEDSKKYISEKIVEEITVFESKYGKISKLNELNASIFFIVLPLREVDKYRKELFVWIKEQKSPKFITF